MDDPNPNDCIIPLCMGGMVSDGPATGEPCMLADGGAGVCNEGGQCGCTAPNAMAPLHVDIVNGTDDTMHGGAAGSCAFKTISYALSLAQGDIHVAPGSYDTNNGETLPFVLNDAQRLVCDEVDGDRPILSGKGEYLTYSVVIAAAGSNNAVIGCRIVGVDEPVYCIDTLNAAGSTELSDNDVSGCLNGVRLVASGVTVSNSFFHDNSFTGVFAQVAPNCAVIGNQFAANGTDIKCNTGEPTLTGASNTGSAGPATCTGCDNCPFQ